MNKKDVDMMDHAELGIVVGFGQLLPAYFYDVGYAMDKDHSDYLCSYAVMAKKLDRDEYIFVSIPLSRRYRGGWVDINKHDWHYESYTLDDFKNLQLEKDWKKFVK